MATKPVELQSLKWPFVGLAILLALSSAWAVYDEVFSRRPWKDFQRAFFKLDEGHLRADLARAEKRLEQPKAKAALDGAKAELLAARQAMGGSSGQRTGYDASVRAEEKAAQDEAEAKLYLGFEKSEADAIYYLVREARHEDSKDQAKLQHRLDEADKKIAEKTKIFEAATKTRLEATAARIAFAKRVDDAQAKVDALLKPAEEIRKKLEAYTAFPGKLPSMEQYWIAGLQNSWGSATVDRCPNCHVAIDKGGYSTPAEVLEAKKNGISPGDFKAQYSIDNEVAEGYQSVYGKICDDLPVISAAIPIGGNPSVNEPAAVAPAAATECRPQATYRRWLEMSEAYCGKQRWLARTKFVLKDEKGAVVPAVHHRGPRVQELEKEDKAGTGHAEHGEDALFGIAQACAAKNVVAAFEAAEKADVYDVKPVFRTHPYRFELLVKSHQPERFGCTTCHGGEGAQTKGVEHKAFRHGKDDHDWNDPLTDEVRILGKKYKGAFLQSKCEKCHSQELTVSHAPTLTAGKKLFIDVGCWGCHPVEGYSDLPKRGPTLTNLISKTTPGWLNAWIAYPKGWRPGTRMPNFWPGAIDGSFVPHAAGETEEQAKARHQKLRAEEVTQISAYLWVNSDQAKLLPMGKAGDAAKGKELFESLGCKACHVNEKGSAARRSEASSNRDYAPNLWNIADKASPEWIYSWIKNPKALWPETKMPDLRLADDEAGDLTAFLLGMKSGESYPAPGVFAEGQRAALTAEAQKGKVLIGKYGCFGCHNIKGFENAQKIGTELTEHGRKDPLLLDFGDVKYFTEEPKHRQTYAGWVWTKLHTPRIYAYERVETRMPQFDFTDDEALSILTFLKGQTGEKEFIPVELRPGIDQQKQAVLAGERLVYWNGCRNCHIVEKRGGTVRDQYNEDNQSFAPPILTGEGAKVQPAWLFGFLKAPVPLRPWLNIRMPTFHFSDEDAAAVVKYFASASNKSYPYLTVDVPAPSKEKIRETLELFTALQCTKCHVVGKLAPGQDPGSAAPNFLMAKSRLRPDWIPLWLRNPNALMEGTLMPSFWDLDAGAEAPHKAFGGDKAVQMEALRDLLMHLGEPGFELTAPGKKTASSDLAPRPRG